MKNGIFIFLLVGVFSCQSRQTKSIEESANVFKTETVLVDTRSAFLYASAHIKGSVNLSSQDFLLLKNPLTKTRVFDPDLIQTIERLAKRGIHPSKKVLLLSDSKDSVEIKKWTWLLKLLEVESIEATGFQDFRKQTKNARYAEPREEKPWTLGLGEDLQNEFIIKKAPDCFVTWSPKKCEKN